MPITLRGNRMPLTARGKWILYPVVAVAIVNFVIFAVVALVIGGDAWNGHVDDGHYYVSSHGTITEVSRAVWYYSYGHVISVWVTHGSVFVVFLWVWAMERVR